MDHRMELTIDCIECQQPQVLKVRAQDLENFKAGKGHVQTIFPYLLPAEREMLLSRICGSCWDRMFKYEDDDDDI